jgi:hypothetical protein
MRPIVVLGAGSWGTALAIQFARGGGTTVLWGREEDDPAELARARTNERYLPGAAFPPALAVEPDLAKALASGDDIVLVVPSNALRTVLAQIQPWIDAPPSSRPLPICPAGRACRCERWRGGTSACRWRSTTTPPAPPTANFRCEAAGRATWS